MSYKTRKSALHPTLAPAPKPKNTLSCSLITASLSNECSRPKSGTCSPEPKESNSDASSSANDILMQLQKKADCHSQCADYFSLP